MPVPVPVLVSGRSDAAVAAQAGRLRELVAGEPGISVADVGLSSALTRAHLEHRAVVVAAGRDELLAGLGALAAGEPAAGVAAGRVAGDKAVFVFPGQGGQWERMGAELARCSPVFAAELAACGEALSEFVDWRLEDVLAGRRARRRWSGSRWCSRRCAR